MRDCWDFCYRYCWRYVSLSHVYEAVLLVVACLMAYNTTSESAALAACLCAIYMLVLVIKFVKDLNSHRANDRLQGEVVWGIFDLLQSRCLGRGLPLRFTLFRIDPANSDYIVPWYRFEKGAGDHPINTAQKSKVRYRKGEGCTGAAWAKAGNKFELTIMPTFANRRDFEAYYEDTMRIDQKTVKAISDHMMSVGLILSCGFYDTRSRFLGVLSIDVQANVKSYTPLVLQAADGTDFAIEGRGLSTAVVLVHNVLRSLAQATGA